MDLPNIQNWLERLTRFHVIFILIFLGIVAYANAVNHPFVHDDVIFLLQNPDLGNLNPKEFFTLTSAPDNKLPFLNQYYRPLLELTNRILYRVIQLNPHGFHFFNVLLHIFNGYLVYNCIRLITDNKKGVSLAVAALFLVHPVQSEAVACISGMSNLVFTFFCLLSLISYLYGSMNEVTSKGPYVFSLGFFILALLSKEQAVILPFIVLIIELCFAQRLFRMPRKKLLPVAGFFIVLAGYFVLRRLLMDSVLSLPLEHMPEYRLVLLAIPRSILMYLSIIFFPHDLHYYRSQDILLPFIGPILLLAAVIITVVLITFKIPNPQKRWMILGLGWFGISLLPTLNIIPMVNEYSNILTAEHFVYFPIIGVLLFVFGIGHHWINQGDYNRKCFASLIMLGGICFICIGMTLRQNTYWRAEIPLFERTLQFEEGFGRVHFLLAKSYANAGRYNDAVIQDQKALAIMKSYLDKIQNKKVQGFYTGFLEQIHHHMGYCLDILGDFAGALEHYNKALSYDNDNLYFHYSVGMAYIKVRNYQKAIDHFNKILDEGEENLMVMNNLAICYQAIGDNEQAGRLLKLIVEKDSQSISAKHNLDNFLNKQQDI